MSESLDWRLVFQGLVTSVVVVVGSVGRQPALGAGLTAVPGLVKSPDAHGKCLKEFLDDVALGVIEVAVEFGSSEGGEIPHPINEKLRVEDAVFPFQFV